MPAEPPACGLSKSTLRPADRVRQRARERARMPPWARKRANESISATIPLRMAPGCRNSSPANENRPRGLKNSHRLPGKRGFPARFTLASTRLMAAGLAEVLINFPRSGLEINYRPAACGVTSLFPVPGDFRCPLRIERSTFDSRGRCVGDNSANGRKPVAASKSRLPLAAP